MKTGIVVLTNAKGDQSKIVSEVLPLDDAVAKARAFQAGTEKSDGFDAVEVWSGAVRRFHVPKSPAPAETAKPSK